jgi:hypothetical protein
MLTACFVSPLPRLFEFVFTGMKRPPIELLVCAVAIIKFCIKYCLNDEDESLRADMERIISPPNVELYDDRSVNAYGAVPDTASFLCGHGYYQITSDGAASSKARKRLKDRGSRKYNVATEGFPDWECPFPQASRKQMLEIKSLIYSVKDDILDQLQKKGKCEAPGYVF